MEKTKSNVTKKVIIAVVSMLLCLTIIGVSVYAALSQTAGITNTITISTSGQVTVSTVIEKANETAMTNTGTRAGVTAANLETKLGATAPTFSPATTLANTATYNDTGTFLFNYETGISWYAYKVTISNTSTATAIDITCDISASGNAQIDVYYGTDWTNLTQATNTAVNAATVASSVAAGAAANPYYIVVAINTALDTASDYAGTANGFTIDFNAAQAAA